MKKYFFALSAIVLAIAFSAFTSKPTTTYVFKLKNGVDKTSATAVADKTNWEITSISCSGTADIPCTITVDESFTQVDGFGTRTLKTSGTTISIQVENGLLDTAPNPYVQYKRVATGVNYTFVNQSLH